MQKQQNFKKISSKFVLLFILLSGCTGPRIHSDLYEDLSILSRKWTLSTQSFFEMGDHGFEFSNPVLSQNTLIFGNRKKGLICLYPSIQQTKWSLSIPGGVISELMISDGTLYFTGGNGFLYSVHADNGQVLWSYDLKNPIASRPTLGHGRLFVNTSDDQVSALDAKTGKLIWEYKRKSSNSSRILGVSSPLIEKNKVLVGFSDGFLVSLTLEEGQMTWEKKLHQGYKFTDINAHPVSDNGTLYIPSYDGSLYSIKDKEILWRFDSGGSKDVAIDDQRVFLPSTDGFIYALEKQTGKVFWKFQLDDGTPTRLVLTNRFVIVGSSYQYLYVLDKRTGKGLYRFNVGYGSGFMGAPEWDPNEKRVYILSGAGNLYSFLVRE